MNRLQKKRLGLILFVVAMIFLCTSLALYALQQNINFFYSPTQVAQGQAPFNHEIRLGGIVQKGSVIRGKQDLRVDFFIQDKNNAVKVIYFGMLPDLFREGQTIVVSGKLNQQKQLMADQVLAKHDERYMPSKKMSNA